MHGKILYAANRVSGKTIGPILKDKAVQEKKLTAGSLKTRPVVCPETSVSNYGRSTLTYRGAKISSFELRKGKQFVDQLSDSYSLKRDFFPLMELNNKVHSLFRIINLL